jgi:hypothetical protein
MPSARLGDPPIDIDVVSNAVRIHAKRQGMGDIAIVLNPE